jgi:hypothetical protein
MLGSWQEVELYWGGQSHSSTPRASGGGPPGASIPVSSDTSRNLHRIK